jgi:hypothetical protein
VSWDALGAIANGIGAVAVVVTLAFLSVQLRQNTLSTRAATTQAVLSAAAEYLERVASDGELTRIWSRGLQDTGALEPAERVRFALLMAACFRRWEAVHLQSTTGALPEPAWEGLRSAMRNAVTQPGGRTWWSSARGHYNASFRSFVDGLLSGGA